MTSRRPLLLLAGLALAPAALPAQAQPRPRAAAAAVSRVTAREIDAHLRFLSSDLLEGRAPATRGGELAAEYIATQLRLSGVQPGVDGSYFQPVPIDVVGAVRSTIRVVASGRATASLRYPEEVVVWAGSATDSSRARGELVFVGYGADAPESRWDDFKGMDLKGKWLLVLVNDPPASASEPELFGGKAMTYYGRWTYKFEEAERRGAAGALIVHTTESASYPWHTVVGSWAREQRMVPRDTSLPAPLGVRGWITDSAASALLRTAGLDLAALRQRAASRDFQPVPTGITIDASFRNTVEHLRSNNVVGVVPGSDPRLRGEYVAYSTHWDHIGIGPKVNGDSIYNGAEDNASGTAALLAVARAAAQAPAKPRRSQVFVFVTAEESGLLGSEWYAQNPTVPIPRIVANVNMDVVPVRGRVRNLRVLGENKSSLGPALARLARPLGLTIAPDERPEAGSFYRSDHFSFAKAGVPAISIAGGTDYEGRPAGWGREQSAEYTARRYHQPSDEYREDWDLAGAAQIADLVLRIGASIGNAPTHPVWNADAEFRRAGAP